MSSSQFNSQPLQHGATDADVPAFVSRTQLDGDRTLASVTRTHAVLVSLVRSYITLVSSEWPAVCRRDPDFSVETAHNYGLGLIRMLAEFQVANGLDDRMSVQLALELSEAKRQAERRVREPLPSTAEPKPSGPRWRRGYRRATGATKPSSASA
jgi:hypothetical protein